MLLQRLAEYADQLDSCPPLYQRKPVRYLIVLDSEGNYLQMVDYASEHSKQGIPLFVPKKKRSVNILPYLLADHASYVLAVPHKETERRAPEMHRRFVALVEDCARSTQEPTVAAISVFLQSLDTDHLDLPTDFDPEGCITFEVDGCRPIDLPSVRTYWATVAAAGDDGTQMECLVCGQQRPAVRRLPIAIQGIPGGQTSGMALISANEDVFFSYGLRNSLIAPTCETCGERFCNALNALLKDKNTHLFLPPLVYIFWTKEPSAPSILPMLSEAKSEDVRVLLESFRGKNAEAAQGETTPFYAACLSARGPRVVVRDWIETTLDNAQRNLARYFLLQRLIDNQGNGRWFPLWQLVKATVNTDAKEQPVPAIGQALAHMALHGGPLPLSLLQLVLLRLRAEQNVKPAQAALIKMILLSQPGAGLDDDLVLQQRKGTLMEDLNPADDTPAYLCGRLLAVLERIQQEALGKDLSSTIVDRYYGSASSAPASVFGRLLRGVQPHLSKIRSDKSKGRTAEWLERDLRQILDPFEHQGKSFPSTLNAIEQGMFALGFYHQKSASIRAAIAAAQQRKEKQQAAQAGTSATLDEALVNGQDSSSN